MPRPKLVDRPITKGIAIPESLVARVDLLLYSEVEGKVPHGAWANLVVGLLRKHLEEIK